MLTAREIDLKGVSSLLFSIQFLCCNGKCPVDREPLFDVSPSELGQSPSCAMIQIETSISVQFKFYYAAVMPDGHF